ncbi:hypothetical protein ACFW2V_38380 [Streptomyces sp. NPDC058947]|uniref:hypothetical protein n=2 Tax=Streptomyces TaxID=1883 RepID=UPI00368C8710
MMSDAVTAAVAELQQRAMDTTDSYALDRIERAMDEILRKPGNETVPTNYRIRSALGHAYETLERRKEIAPRAEIRTEGDEPGYTEQGYHRIEMLEWIRFEPAFGKVDRIILSSLATGEDAVTLSERHCLPVTRMRERISRCRRVARQAWAKLGLAA